MPAVLTTLIVLDTGYVVVAYTLVLKYKEVLVLTVCATLTVTLLSPIAVTNGRPLKVVISVNVIKYPICIFEVVATLNVVVLVYGVANAILQPKFVPVLATVVVIT